MTTVLGREVTGTITREHKADQWSSEKFEELLNAVFAFEEVESIRWHQYTPYFNDGEACIFGVHECSIKFTDNDESGDYGDGYVDKHEMADHPNGYRQPAVARSGFESIYPVFVELSDSLEHFEDFFEESFGDHAVVTATRTGFNVEFYEHD